MTVTIEPLHCGSLTAPRAGLEAGGSMDPVALPVPSWLIRHPKGIVLFDTGMHPDAAGPSAWRTEVERMFGVDCGPDDLIDARLEAADVDPADVAVVVASHLHYDHVGGLVLVPNARLVVHADEWAAGFDPDLVRSNFFRAAEYDLGHDVTAVDGEHDLFGDGLITCLPTPGHTPGHQSLRVRLASREVVLCGDCAYFETTLAGGPLPPFGHDLARQAESVEHLRRLRAEGALVIPGHDPGLFDVLPPVLS
jgi:N-acyl homoserine lactone hydrolase